LPRRARIVVVLVAFDDFRSGGGHKLSHIDFNAMPGFWLQADIGLLEVFPRVWIAVTGVNDVKGLTEAYVEVKADGRRRMVDGDLPHADVRRVGADVEVPQPVEAGRGIVEVRIHVPVEQESEVRTPLMEGPRVNWRWCRRRRGSSRRRLSGRRRGGGLRLNGGRKAQQKAQ